MSSTATTNAVEVYNEFYSFTTKEMERTLKTAVRKASNEILKSARRNLRSAYKNTNKVNPNYNDTLQKGIRASKVKNIDGDIYVKLRAHSNNKHGSGSYRLPMLEGGTKDRYARTRNGVALTKPAYRGRLEGRAFFNPAISAGRSNYDNILTQQMNACINKINAKKFI